MVLVMKTLEDEWYVGMRASKFIVSEDLFVLSYIGCLHYSYLQIIIHDNCKTIRNNMKMQRRADKCHY